MKCKVVKTMLLGQMFPLPSENYVTGSDVFLPSVVWLKALVFPNDLSHGLHPFNLYITTV